MTPNLQYAVARDALCIYGFEFLKEFLIEGGMRDTQDCIDFCAKKGIQPDTELVGLKLDGRVVMLWTWIPDEVDWCSSGFMMMPMGVRCGFQTISKGDRGPDWGSVR